MQSLGKPRVKICCMNSIAEAQLAIHYGAAAVGLVSEMPSGPGIIPEPLIANIATVVPPGVASFLLTSKQRAEPIIEQQRRCRTNTVQLVDRIPIDEYAKLRAAMPGIALVQVIHIVDQTAIAAAQDVAPHVDAILLDSGNPNLPVKRLGGTGRTHNWQFSRQIRDSVAVPIFLAGGLRPENIAQAIETVQPYAVDICSGVRTNGRLDEQKLAALFGSLG